MLNRRISLGWALGLAVMLARASAMAATNVESPLAKPHVGSKLANCSFTDFRYLPRTLRDFVSDKDPVRKRAFVLIFTNTTCPIVQKYMPRLKQLSNDYRDKGVQFLAVDVGPDDSILEICTQAVEHDMPFPFVKDIDGSCTVACGVDRTATAVLVDSDYKIRYRGRIDNSLRLGGATPGPASRELRDAIDALLAGKKIDVNETPVDGCLITKQAPVKAMAEFDYAKQIAPIVEKNCAMCHREGTSAPFSLTTAEEVAANAAMIREVVEQRRMPPWYASPGIGKFSNDRTMADADRKLLLKYVSLERPAAEHSDAVAVEKANNKLATKPGDSWEGVKWLMGAPDAVYEVIGTYDVPAEGYVDYKYSLLPTLFLNDTYIEAAEVQPSNPRVVHHSNLGYMPIGQKGMYAKLITGYVPGVGPMQLDNNVASKIPAGSAIGLQIHLTTTGKPEKTKLRVGFRYPRYKVDKELYYLQLSNQQFAIPPYAAHYPVSRTKTLPDDVTIYGFFAHMHVRGQDVTFKAFAPKADPVTLLMIPNYNFDWQMPYHVAYGDVKFPANTKFECVAHYDNTTFNPYNPDPSATVRDGQQTYEEMMYGYMFYTKDKEHLGLEIDTSNGRPK